MTSPSRTTLLIRRLADGDRSAADALFEEVYREIHTLACRHLGQERVGHTLQPTAIVHEAFIRLVSGEALACTDRAHFMSLAARVIRRLLIDHARQRLARKRSGRDPGRIPIGDGAMTDETMAALDESLTSLQRENPRQARVVELHFFGGMAFEDIGRLLGVSATTTRADWYFARAWLRRALEC